MVSYSSGGAAPIPGLSSDGQNGILVAGALTAGDRNAVGTPTFHRLYGATICQDTPANNTDAVNVLQVRQTSPVLDGDNAQQALYVLRSGSIAAGDYQTEQVAIYDTVVSANPMLYAHSRLGNTFSAGFPGTADVDTGGHILNFTAPPTVSHNGPNVVGTMLRASDVRGIINLLLSSTGSAANAELCTVTFTAAYTTAPIIVVSALDDAIATALPLGAFYVDQTTDPLTTFMLKCTSALAAGTYRCAYLIVG